MDATTLKSIDIPDFTREVTVQKTWDGKGDYEVLRFTRGEKGIDMIDIRIDLYEDTGERYFSFSGHVSFDTPQGTAHLRSHGRLRQLLRRSGHDGRAFS